MDHDSEDVFGEFLNHFTRGRKANVQRETPVMGRNPETPKGYNNQRPEAYGQAALNKALRMSEAFELIGTVSPEILEQIVAENERLNRELIRVVGLPIATLVVGLAEKGDRQAIVALTTLLGLVQ
jgi:hypothetical protein